MHMLTFEFSPYIPYYLFVPYASEILTNYNGQNFEFFDQKTGF